MPEPAEQQLIAKAQAGDQVALADLLQTYQDRLYNVVLRIVQHRDDAVEVTQDAMVKIIEHIGEFERGSAISTWMIRIAMNLSISLLRKRKLRGTVSLDGDGSGRSGSDSNDQLSPLRTRLADSREPMPDQCVQQREMIAQLNDCIARLPTEFRSVLVLRDIDQMDYQTIGQVLSVPVGTVKSRLFRARLALRREMLKTDPSSASSPTVNALRQASMPEVADG